MLERKSSTIAAISDWLSPCTVTRMENDKGLQIVESETKKHQNRQSHLHTYCEYGDF